MIACVMKLEEVRNFPGSLFPAMFRCNTVALNGEEHISFGNISTPSQCRIFKKRQSIWLVNEASLSDHLSVRRS